MTDKELRSKYPDVWDNVESSMIEWLTSTANMPGLYIDLYKDDPENSKLGIIAHNAAFAACVELHKYLKTNQKTGGMIMYYRECEENKATHTAAPLGNLDKEIYLEELPQPEQDAKERYEEAIKSMMPITISPWDFTKIDNALQIASGYNPPKQ